MSSERGHTMDLGDVIKTLGTIIVAAIAAFGGGFLTYKKFIIERQDAKEEKQLQALINASNAKLKEEIRVEIKDAVQQGIVDCGVIGDRAIKQSYDKLEKKLELGLNARGEEGKERFETHAAAIKEINEQIKANSKQIAELTELTKAQLENQVGFTESLAALNKVVAASAESQCNANYDRLLIVTNKVLKSGKMTVSDKTNIKQLYNSWKELGGKDPTGKMDTMYEECMGMSLTIDDI